jgi:pimeloyl-ACP methyl ester carboxylesterase
MTVSHDARTFITQRSDAEHFEYCNLKLASRNPRYLIMATIRTSDAQLFYEVSGDGPSLVLLHPFPLNHNFWAAVAEQLASRYRLIIPDLRAHGASELGNGPATMRKLADDLARICREEKAGGAAFVGVSVGGYLLFEFWRRYRDQVAALVLANTRAGPETPESKAVRLQGADRVLREGTAGFIQEMLSKLLSPATRTNCPDIVDAARKMMQAMSPEDVAGVQRGMAERPDSVATLGSISVPTLIIAGADDTVPFGEFELMRQGVSGSELRVIPGAGHYAALEKPEEFGGLLRKFLEKMPRR